MNNRTTLHTLSVTALALCSSALFAAEPAPKPAPPSAEVAKVMLSAERWSSADVNAVARFVSAPQFIYVSQAAGTVFHVSGNPMLQLGADYGKVLQVGDTTREGVYWNFGGDPASVRIGDGPETVELPPKSLIVIGNVLKDEDRARALPGIVIGPEGEVKVYTGEVEGGVTCGAGYFACCMENSGGFTITAKCIADNSPNLPLCNSGGPGASACEIGASLADFNDAHLR
jgi:hypothetical protein